MTPKYVGHVKCPYCGFANRVNVNEQGSKVVTCNIDEGGCEKPFVLNTKINVEFSVDAIASQQGAP